jgi:hypothetical protein
MRRRRKKKKKKKKKKKITKYTIGHHTVMV